NEQRLTLQVADIEGQLIENQEQKRNAVNSLNHWQTETEQASASLETCREYHFSTNEHLPKVELEFREKQEKHNSCQRDLLLIEQALQQEENHHAHADRILRQLEVRRERLKLEVDTLPRVDHAALSQLQQEVEDLNNNYHQKDTALEQVAIRLSTASESKEQVAEKVQSIQQILTQIKARFDALQRLQMQLESNQALKTWLTKHQFEDMSRLWQGIQIVKGWEDALEAVLRERLNGAGFEKLEIVEQWNDDLPPGKWTLFQKVDEQPVKIAPHHQVGWKPILAYLTCVDLKIEPVLDEWLSNIYVVNDLHSGLLERRKLSLGEMLVTPEGHIFTAHSLTFFSPDSQLHGVLARQQELNQLGHEIKTLEVDLEEEKFQLVVAEQTCDELNETIISLRHDCELLKQQRHDLQLQIIKRSQSAEQTDKRRNQIEEELIEINKQLEVETLLKQEAQAKAADYAQQIVAFKDQLQELKRQWQSAESLLVEQRQLVQAAMEKLQEAIFHENTCQHKISDIEKTIQVISDNIQRLEESRGSLLVEQSNIDETKLNNQLQDCLSQRIKLEHTISEARNALEVVTNELQALEKARLVSEQKLHPLREAVNTSRLKEQEAHITELRYSEQLAEASADENALLPLLGDARKKTLQADIERLTAEIEALGAVNLAALDELQTLQTRETYLESQLNDLKDAVNTLENVIRQIDNETQERLLETFNSVNDNLGRVFPAIFGGGHAKLQLSSDEILDSGILLTAQPPGKKNSSIHLLSGGEKALTALALVFSLFQLNPAPFCLLDEVDAPLDDSNTGRFCELVKQMSKETQFMFISHNKITMEMAQQLIGVTMQEQGVSRIVAVDIDEAIRLNEAVVA
ncbi:MAG: chromosome segregation protein SMC, partial [Nitrosomonas sp.]|nr:chromosome segregation protein SMC [Nitrosomonas sp.]